MAESERKSVAVYRSVSFRKLGCWNSRTDEQQNQPVDSEAVDPKRTSSTPLSSISPSIRQLTEKFGSSAGTRTASPGDGAVVTRGSSTLPRAKSSRGDGGARCRKSFHEDSGGGYFQDTDTTTNANSKLQKFHSGTDSVSGSDSEKRIGKRICRSSEGSTKSGKRDYSQISACPSDPRKTLTTDEEQDVTSRRSPSPCKPHRSYLSTHHCDFLPLHADNWPSVTKIRQIFDERQGSATQQHKTDACESLKAAGRGQVHELSASESAPLSEVSDSANESSGLSLQGKCMLRARSRVGSAARETFGHDMDFTYPKGAYQLYSNDEEVDIETHSSNESKVSGRNSFQSSSSSHICTGGGHCHKINPSAYRSHSPGAEAEAEAAHKTLRPTGLTPDPGSDLQPPATLSWSRSESLDTSSCSSSLQQPTGRERRDRQGVGLPRDSLHSSHSSSRALAPTSSHPPSAPTPDKAIASCTVAPSTELRAPVRVDSSHCPRWRFSSGDEKEEHSRRRKGGGGGGWNVPSCLAPSLSGRAVERGTTARGGSYLSSNKNGWLGAKGIGRSSGSEDDSPGSIGPHSREAVRRRSLRKKKKSSGASQATGRDDYDDHDGESEDSDSDTALKMEHLERHHQQNAGREFAGTRPRSYSAREPSSLSSRDRVQQWERISTPATSTTLPGVSRVSKVNIPPFVSSPGGSCCSSRYSSTETLKTASSSMLSKTYHGNFTMYRSPSFGHGDNFSRTHLRVRPKIVPMATPVPTVLARESGVSAGVNCDNENKNRISVSNPDITSETMSLLSFLKSDLSELKVRKTSGDKAGVTEGSAVYRMGSRSHGGTLLPSGRRPSLKDLTATLRRAKSFTYSDKPPKNIRCYLTGGATKRSNSEQQLDVDGERDGGRLSMYVLEARQVIQDICQMSTREDDDADERRTDDYLKEDCFQVEQRNEKEERENMFCDRSVDELSGHESSLTDEGIVTEPEMGASEPSEKSFLGSAGTDSDSIFMELSSNASVNNVNAASEEINTNSTVLQRSAGATGGGGGTEAPATPNTIRRRRKFTPHGNNITGSDSSNGSNAESTIAAVGNGESIVYRSLSDPMPQRHCSVEEGKSNFSSVDSNLLGSLFVKGGGGCSPEASVPEYKGSVASDLSIYSDCGLRDDALHDYSGVIRSIVAEPGAMDRLMTDDHGNSKIPKKKSFSDPSRRSDAPLLSQNDPPFKGQTGSAKPICELDQSSQIPPSSSEPILTEQREELWEPDVDSIKVKKIPSQSECTPHSDNLDDEDVDVTDQDVEETEMQKFNFDLKLAGVLSPRIIRRPCRRLQSDLKTRPKHVRHASEPTSFIPISPPPHLQPVKESAGRKHPLPPAFLSPPLLQPAVLLLVQAQHKCFMFLRVTTWSQCDIANTQSAIGRYPRSRAQTDTSSKDMRKHVMMTLLDTEQSYVESLRTLIQGYMRPLKQPDGGSIVDPLLVDEMFYQIPEILEHHEQFLEQVSGCVGRWHDRQTIGHILIQSFSKETLANMYSAYIDNFLNAKDAVRIAKEAKPAFHKFLEQNMRENKEKQALGDLMIKPVQRIPRYELLVKDLLKHTPEDHPDHLYLLDAQRDIKRLAERINKGRHSAEEAEREARVIQEIEAHIEGVEHILNPQRKFLRQEMVMEAKTVGGKKDRSLFLFSDLIICTTLKRKSGSLRRSSMSLYSAASAIDTSSKYKFLWKLLLEDVEMVKCSTQATNRESIQKTINRLDEDLSTLGQISKLSETLSFPHQSLDEAIKDLMASVHRELSEKQSLAFSMTFLPTKLEFTTASAESSFVFEFTSPDARSNFEQAFEEAKKKLAMNKDQWDPEFLKAIPIMKTRSGMQFSCASPSHSCPDSSCEVWVCNSDGYVGQVCLLNIKDEPTVEACIAVCSARIICIAAVPGLKGRSARTHGYSSKPSATTQGLSPAHTQQQLHISISHSSLELAEQPSGQSMKLVPFDSDDTDDEDSPSPSSTLQSQASHSTISSSYGSARNALTLEEQEFPVASSYSAPGMLRIGAGGRAHTESTMDGRAMRRSSRGSFTRASLEDLLSIDPEAYQSSVWLGTEDGCIHVYQSSDNIRNRKNSMKMHLSVEFPCVTPLYSKTPGSFWDPQSSQTLALGTPSSPVTKMVPVGGKLWCGSQNRVLIINTTTLVQEVGTDSSRCVTCMVAYGQGVWLALQGSAQVRLYHAQSWDSLTEVDVAPAVHKMLSGADAIIRQHKAACLRITALLACKDLLWIGTSAGVVLTLTIPAVSAGTGAATLKSPLVPMGSAHGHTGHVRFLTSIELPEGYPFFVFLVQLTDNLNQRVMRDSARRRASAHIPPKSNHLVISGGDGYEDFRLTNSSETVGRDDSTNHLLLWRV
uniref:DH domain-containing protein n=1 Tax=Mola mola TaxID=94237 RepID=A0A3Q4B9R7_MOLML